MANVIMVPLDGSPLAEQVLPLAVSLAQQIDGSILLMQALYPMQMRHTPRGLKKEEALRESLRQNALQYLKQIEERLTEVNIPCITSVIERDSDLAITDLAQKHEVSYIVMSTHGRTGFSRWALGSVTERVLQQSDYPLIIMRPEEKPPLNAFDSLSLKRIVVPLDGSPLAEQVLPKAKQIAQAYKAELLLFYAIPPIPPALLMVGSVSIANNWDENEQEEAKTYLKKMVSNLQSEGFMANFTIGNGPAADAILSYSDHVKADMIAMTTHARPALGRLILGSVTDRVVRAGETPVLVTRP